MRLMIVGHGRHGKDQVAEYLEEQGYTYKSSSLHCAEIVFQKTKEKYGYSNVKECFEDRHNHRKEWFDIITAYNQPDGTRIAREIYEEVDIYVGMRNIDEFTNCKKQNVFDCAIWVDATQRLPKENSQSMQIRKEDCDCFIDNNGSLENLKNGVKLLATYLALRQHFEVICKNN